VQERQRTQRSTRPHRADHRRERLFEQQIACAHVRAEHNGGVVRFGFEIDVVIGGGGQRDLQIRLLALHLQQGSQPHGAGWRLQPDHGLLARAWSATVSSCSKADCSSGSRALPCGKAAARARGVQKAESQTTPQGGNLTAHGALRQAQLFCRMGKIQVTRGD
jgi:hypothetical protein